MVCHSTPVYIIESCPLPPHTSDAPSMVKTLNVTFEHHMSVQAYYHVPNRDIHHPEPWTPGKIGSSNPALIAIDRISEVKLDYPEVNARCQFSVFAVINGLFPGSFFHIFNTNPAHPALLIHSSDE